MAYRNQVERSGRGGAGRAAVRSSDLGVLGLRLVVGATLAAHGYPKLFGGPDRTPPAWLTRLLGRNFPAAVEHGGPDAFAAALERLGVARPALAARAAGLAEFGGGLALAAGFLTPAAAAVAAANMAVAVRQAHWSSGFYGVREGGYEFALLLGAGAAALGLTGPGALSVDALLGWLGD